MNTVHIEVGGELKRLRFDFNAMSDIEQYAGRGVGALFHPDNMGFNTIRLLYWGGLKWENPGLTIQKAGMIVGQMIKEGYTLEQLGELAAEAIEKGGFLGPGDQGPPESEDKAEAENPTKKPSPRKSKNSR